MKVTTGMLSDFFKTLRFLHRVQQDKVSYRELIEFLYKETPPEDNNFLRYNCTPHIEEVIKFGTEKKNAVLFSIIIPTYNRCELLTKTINAAAGQNIIPLGGLELVIIDNGSKDATKEVVTHFASSRRHLRVVYVKLKNNHGPPFARNLGVIYSRGSLVAFCDDDFLVPPDWLSAFKRELDADPEIAGVGGFKVPKSTKNDLDIYHRFLMWGHFFQAHVRTKDASFFNRCGIGANVCYRREVFEKLGGINLYFKHVGFREFKARISKSGLKLLYEPKMVEHFADFSLTTHIRKLFPQGWDWYLLHVLHPDIQRSPSFSYFLKRIARDIRVIFTNKEKKPFFNGSFREMISFSLLSVITNFFLWFGKYWTLFTRRGFVR